MLVVWLGLLIIAGIIVIVFFTMLFLGFVSRIVVGISVLLVLLGMGRVIRVGFVIRLLIVVVIRP